MSMLQTIEPLPGFTFGCDPELFIYDNSRSKYISADKIIPGSKKEPARVKQGAVQPDGMAAEFNIDPASCFEEFEDNVQTVLQELKSFLPPNCELHAVPSVEFDEDVWASTRGFAKILGCTPDFNAWTGSINPKPDTQARPRLRTASGHLHIGWTNNAKPSDADHIRNCNSLVKQLDFYLGAWSLTRDPDPVRRQLYGRAGACRYKPYGTEYRVLSNFWLNSLEDRKIMWNRMCQAIADLPHNFLPLKNYEYSEILIQAINDSDLETLLENKFVFLLEG